MSPAPRSARPAASPVVAAPAGAPVAVRGVVTVVGAKTNAGAVVTLEAPGLAPAAPLAEPMKVDQKGFRFLPHVTVVPTGSAVVLVVCAAALLVLGVMPSLLDITAGFFSSAGGFAALP